MLIIASFGSIKTNALLNLIKEQDRDDLIDKIYLNTKSLNEPKRQFFIRKREDVGMKYLNDPKTIIEYSQHMNYVWNNNHDYNPNRKKKSGLFLMI